jgi:hypothetical protein
MAAKRLVDINGLSAEKGLRPRQIRTLYQTGKISYIKTGHRTILFDPEKVVAELEKFEVRAIGARSSSRKCAVGKV